MIFLWFVLQKGILFSGSPFAPHEKQYRWADENIGYNVGEVVLQNGRYLEDRSPEEGTKAAYDLAAEIMGEDLEDWGYTLSEDKSTYEWHDMVPIPEPITEQHSRSGDAR